MSGHYVDCHVYNLWTYMLNKGGLLASCLQIQLFNMTVMQFFWICTNVGNFQAKFINVLKFCFNWFSWINHLGVLRGYCTWSHMTTMAIEIKSTSFSVKYLKTDILTEERFHVFTRRVELRKFSASSLPKFLGSKQYIKVFNKKQALQSFSTKFLLVLSNMKLFPCDSY